MKLIYLKMEGFGSFYNKAEVDFSKIKSGVFLISGETGAGKTTIFDAVVFALYADASGSARAAEDLRSDFCIKSDITRVHLTFEINGLTYIIEREMTLAEDLKPRITSSVLIKPDGSTVSGYKRNHDPVTDYITGLLGINARQFTQICLLPQGEFIKIIKPKADSKDEEREIILSRLFGTDIFTQFQKKINDYALDAARKCEKCASDFSLYIEELERVLFSSGIQNELSERIASYKKIREKPNGKYFADTTLPDLIKSELEKERNGLNENIKIIELDKIKYLETASEIKTEKEKNTQYLKLNVLCIKYNELTEKAENVNLKDINDKIEKTKEKINEVIKKKNSLQEISIKINQYKILQAELSEKAAETYRIREELIKTETEYESAYNKYISGQAAFLASALEEGKPCPVCGSLIHPDKCIAADDMPKEADIKKLKENINIKNADYQKKQNEYSRVSINMDNIKCELTEKNDNILRITEIDTENIENLLIRIQLMLNETEEEVLLNNENINILKSKAESIIRLREEEISLAAEIKGLKENLGDYKYKNIEETEIIINELNNRIKSFEKEISEKSIIVSSVENLYNRLFELSENHKMLYSTYINVNEIANWNKGQGKISFSRYVLGLFLDEVLANTNKRLIKMTENRFALIRKTGDKSTGLEINVYDSVSRTERSSMTLSGGEKFKASLAMALGMSETVQSKYGGIKINTLLIDEGFDSLDDNSVNRALDTLAEISESDVLIGLISHLDLLKNRIERRIRVERTDIGSVIHSEI